LSDEQEALYRVTFLGPVHNDLANVNKLAEGLRDRFKLSEEAVTKMMRTAPVAIKKEATLAEAQQYKEVLEAIGAKVQVDPIEEVKEEPQQTEESPPFLDSEPQSVSVQEIPLPPSSETVAPEKEEPQQTEEAPPPLDREPQVIPVKGKTPSTSAESARSSGTKADAASQMVKCPQCGYVQEETDECFKCGVIISKFLKYQEEVKPAGVERAAPGTVGPPSAGGPQPQRMIGTPMEEPTGSTPWEDMANLGFFTAFFRTIKEVLFSPSQFFRSMPVNKDMQYPLIYGILMGFFVGLFSLFWQYAFSGISGQAKGTELLFTSYFIIFYALIIPIILAIQLFAISGVFHTSLMIVGGDRRGFDATFRVVAYISTIQLLSIVVIWAGSAAKTPFLFILLFFIFFFYAAIMYSIGFKESHQISTGKAVFAVLLPAIIVLALGIIIAVMFVPLILSLIPQMMMQQQPPGF
jgi:hypothetical protein